MSEKVLEEVPLKNFSTFGIGGPARFFFKVTTAFEMEEAFQFAKKQSLPFFILGKGSNCLFDDRGFDGLVIQNCIQGVFFEKNVLRVGSGESFSALGKNVSENFSGLEFAAGIPASVGGAIFMNAGAGGQNVSQIIQSVLFLEETGKKHVFQRNELEFGYRSSSFQKKKGAILEATFLLKSSSEAFLNMQQLLECRRKSQPYEKKSAGCVFRNPDQKNPAGMLIEKSGLKGKQIGGAKISDVHANFIVNERGATMRDVLDMIQFIQEEVKQKTGFCLEVEIQQIPYQMER